MTDMAKTWGRFCVAWGFVRQILSIRGLLDWLGWKQAVTVGIMAIATWVGGHVSGLSIFESIVCALVVLASVIFVWRALSFNQQPLSSVEQSKEASQIVGGPEIVVDYNFEQRKSWEALNTRNTNREAPLVIRNISTKETAYNVRVLPLMIEGETVTFEPAVIPYIEASGKKDVAARVPGGSPLTIKALPIWLGRSYKDTSTEELFSTKSFPLTIEYESGGSPNRTYQTECQIRYRHWHHVVDIGTTKRRLKP
jgi:hypothetical protein